MQGHRRASVWAAPLPELAMGALLAAKGSAGAEDALSYASGMAGGVVNAAAWDHNQDCKGRSTLSRANLPVYGSL